MASASIKARNFPRERGEPSPVIADPGRNGPMPGNVHKAGSKMRCGRNRLLPPSAGFRAGSATELLPLEFSRQKSGSISAAGGDIERGHKRNFLLTPPPR